MQYIIFQLRSSKQIVNQQTIKIDNEIARLAICIIKKRIVKFIETVLYHYYFEWMCIQNYCRSDKISNFKFSCKERIKTSSVNLLVSSLLSELSSSKKATHCCNSSQKIETDFLEKYWHKKNPEYISCLF